MNFIFATGHVDAVSAGMNDRRFRIFTIDMRAPMKTEQEIIERIKQMQAECETLLAELAALKRTALKVDDKVMVRMTDNGEWERRHFSHFDENGVIWCFFHGKTGWAGCNETSEWKYWRLPTEDEL